MMSAQGTTLPLELEGSRMAVACDTRRYTVLPYFHRASENLTTLAVSAPEDAPEEGATEFQAPKQWLCNSCRLFAEMLADQDDDSDSLVPITK